MPHCKLRSLGWSFLFCLLATTGNILALDGTVITKLNLDKEEVGKPPSASTCKVNATSTETVLVQADPRDSTAREIVLIGKDDGSGAKKITFDYPTPVGGVLDVNVEFTIRQMDASTDGPDRFSNVWSFILSLGSNNLIFTIGAGEGDKRLFDLAGVKDAQGQPVVPLNWTVGESNRVHFAFDFTKQKLDVTVNGTPWLKGASLPTGSSGLNSIRIGDGQTVGGVAKHPSQLAISNFSITQPDP